MQETAPSSPKSTTTKRARTIKKVKMETPREMRAKMERNALNKSERELVNEEARVEKGSYFKRTKH